MANILVYDPSPILLAGISHFISEAKKNLTVFGATNTDMMEAMFHKDKMDFVVLSTGGDFNFYPVLQKIDKNIPVVLYYASFQESVKLMKQFENIKGLISKKADASQFTKCIELLTESKQAFCQISWDAILEQFLSSSNVAKKPIVSVPSAETAHGELTNRQSEIMELLKQGKKTSEIADILQLKPSTISSTKITIFKKLKVSNLAQLINYKSA